MSSGLQIATSPDYSEKLTRDSSIELERSGEHKSYQSERIGQYSPRKFQRQLSSQGRQYGKFSQAQKRRATFSGGLGDGKYLSFHNKWKKKDTVIVRPTKFLLGGNSSDPLNLGSLDDEEINKSLNEKTPQTSPYPTPQHKMHVQVLIPPNINDPLNLNEGSDIDDIEANLISPRIKKKKHKKRKKHVSEEDLYTKSTDDELDEKTVDLCILAKLEPPKKLPIEESPKLVRSKRVEDKIVSPVVPQPGSWKTPVGIRSIKDIESEKEVEKKSSEKGKPSKRGKHFRRLSSQEPSNIQKKREVFQYGNFNRYYGYRNVKQPDYRLSCFKRHWFENKDVLDIGCNVGFVTLQIAREFAPKKIIGMDIDGRLVGAARKNIRHYMDTRWNDRSGFPISFSICHGPLVAGPLSNDVKKQGFPSNVHFMQGNYVLESDELVRQQNAEYDVILCLSLSKWIHLNWGDTGLKRAFRRMYTQLRPGGILILEVQPWSSYGKRKKLTETTFNNYCNISLRPERFNEFLLSNQVGFKSYEVIDIPYNQSRGFRRPLLLFRKGHETVKNQASPVQHETISSGLTVMSESITECERNVTSTISDADNVNTVCAEELESRPQSNASESPHTTTDNNVQNEVDLNLPSNYASVESLPIQNDTVSECQTTCTMTAAWTSQTSTETLVSDQISSTTLLSPRDEIAHLDESENSATEERSVIPECQNRGRKRSSGSEDSRDETPSSAKRQRCESGE